MIQNWSQKAWATVWVRLCYNCLIWNWLKQRKTKLKKKYSSISFLWSIRRILLLERSLSFCLLRKTQNKFWTQFKWWKPICKSAFHLRSGSTSSGMWCRDKKRLNQLLKMGLWRSWMVMKRTWKIWGWMIHFWMISSQDLWVLRIRRFTGWEKARQEKWGLRKYRWGIRRWSQSRVFSSIRKPTRQNNLGWIKAK